MEEGELGERTPFWIGQIEMDENPATDEFGRRRDPIDPNDEFMISWWGVYDFKQSYPTITNKVESTWIRRCKHACESAQRWGHACKMITSCSIERAGGNFASKSGSQQYNEVLCGC
eukprot:4035081-Pleurochrysis_carterae.AAC.1